MIVNFWEYLKTPKFSGKQKYVSWLSCASVEFTDPHFVVTTYIVLPGDVVRNSKIIFFPVWCTFKNIQRVPTTRKKTENRRKMILGHKQRKALNNHPIWLDVSEKKYTKLFPDFLEKTEQGRNCPTNTKPLSRPQGYVGSAFRNFFNSKRLADRESKRKKT